MTGVAVVSSGCRGGGKRKEREEEKQSQASLITFLASAFRKSLVQCHLSEEELSIDISCPSEVRHVAHVTFDRFHGFLGLPIEFELQVPRQAPSASVNVFGISPDSMQCGYDSKGNSVPIILLLMQERLCSQGGLKEEGIFRINPENGKEKDVRQQLSKGILPDDIDVHCLASLIKAWFRELPEGVMDTLSPGQVLQCETEEDYANLVKLLPPTQYALFNWAIELMADVVKEEKSNKMNVRNIVVVFAPNMTHLSDPLTSLMHAVQVMNMLKILVLKASREREEQMTEVFWPSSCSPSSQDALSGELSGEEMFDEQSGYDDELSLSCYGDEDMEEEEEEKGLRRDSSSTNEHCNITEELVKEIEECFLKQLDRQEDDCKVSEEIDYSSDKATTHLSTPELEEEFSFSPLSERNQDCTFRRSSELKFRSLLVKNAIKMIEGTQSNESSFGTIVVGNVAKMLEERNGTKDGPIQEITLIDCETNSGKAADHDSNCIILF